MSAAAQETRPSGKPIRTTGAGCLFVLGDEGVFFSVGSQELYVFNTTATFIWCCIEFGMPADEIVRYYSDAISVSATEARAHVAAVLDQWYGLGYIEDPGFEPQSTLPLSTALARLLRNPELRAAFAAGPAETARRLRVATDDIDAFLSLDPASLDAQAARSYDRQVRRILPESWTDSLFSTAVDGDRIVLDLAVDGRLRNICAPAVERRYRMLTTVFCLRFESAAAEMRIHAALGHLEVDKPLDHHVILDVVEGEGGYVILHDLVPRAYCRQLDQLTPLLKSLVTQIAINRYRFFLQIHAAVVSNGDACIVLPGAPGAGKTTLTIGLMHAGFEYFSDEVALLEEESLQLRPFTLGMGIKPGAVAVLAALCPQLRALDAHSREDGQSVRYLTPPRERCAAPDVTRPAAWLVFPRYAANVTTELKPIGKSEALRRLVDEFMVLPQLFDEVRVEKLVQWMRKVECFELPMSSLETAVDLLRRHCALRS